METKNFKEEEPPLFFFFIKMINLSTDEMWGLVAVSLSFVFLSLYLALYVKYYPNRNKSKNSITWSIISSLVYVSLFLGIGYGLYFQVAYSEEYSGIGITPYFAWVVSLLCIITIGVTRFTRVAEYVKLTHCSYLICITLMQSILLFIFAIAVAGDEQFYKNKNVKVNTTFGKKVCSEDCEVAVCKK